MSTPNYIPQPDADFSVWETNFATTLNGDPGAYGLLVGDLTGFNTASAAWAAAYLLTSDPATRSPANIAAKDTARSNETVIIRYLVNRIQTNPAVTNDAKISLGITVRSTTRTPVPPVTVAPTMAWDSLLPGIAQLRYYNGDTPRSKAKPVGVIGVQLFWTMSATVGGVASLDPADARYVQTFTKAPNIIVWDMPDKGKNVNIWGRFVTRGGPGAIQQTGPWSNMLSTTLI